MVGLSKKIENKGAGKDISSFISKDEIVSLSSRAMELKDLIIMSAKKKEFSLMKKYSQELADVIKKLKKYQKILKKQEKIRGL